MYSQKLFCYSRHGSGLSVSLCCFEREVSFHSHKVLPVVSPGHQSPQKIPTRNWMSPDATPCNSVQRDVSRCRPVSAEAATCNWKPLTATGLPFRDLREDNNHEENQAHRRVLEHKGASVVGSYFIGYVAIPQLVTCPPQDPTLSDARLTLCEGAQ